MEKYIHYLELADSANLKSFSNISTNELNLKTNKITGIHVNQLRLNSFHLDSDLSSLQVKRVNSSLNKEETDDNFKVFLSYDNQTLILHDFVITPFFSLKLSFNVSSKEDKFFGWDVTQKSLNNIKFQYDEDVALNIGLDNIDVKFEYKDNFMFLPKFEIIYSSFKDFNIHEQN